MSTIKVTNIQNPSSGTDDIQIDPSGNVTIGGVSFDAGAASGSVNLDSSGRLLVGTSSFSGNATQVLQGQSGGSTAHALLWLNRGSVAASTDTPIGVVNFGNSEKDLHAQISAFSDAAGGSGDCPGRLVFSTTADGASSPTERMRITSGGRVGINDDTNGYGELLQIDGTGNPQDGYCLATKVGGTSSRFHVRFGDTTGVIGSITSNAGTVAYNPFLGCHWGRLANSNKEEILVGTILETIDKEVEWNFAVFQSDKGSQKLAWNGTEAIGSTVEVEFEGKIYQATIEPESIDENVLNKHVCVKVSDTLSSPAVFGVFLSYDSDEGSTNFIGSWNDLYVASVGNFFVRIDKDEAVAIGDLITSGGNGCGIVQQSDTITNKTVGKVTSTKKHKIYTDGSYLVTCVLYCG